jgi:tetratricopeptide (TPR) repeat protein
MWAIRRGSGDYHAALEMADRYAEAAKAGEDPAAVHLGDRMLALTHHYLGNQALARQLAERALSEPRHIRQTLGIGFQVETPIATRALLARILWLQGFPDQAMHAAQQAIDAATSGGHPFSLCYALILACINVPLWTGALDEAQRRIDLLIEHGSWEPAIKPWIPCLAGILGLRKGDERDALIAAFVEARIDLSTAVALAEMVSQPEISVPSPADDNGEVLWNSAELLRVDAELMLWHDAPGAAKKAEKKLLRSLEIARQQSALSWELRSAMSLARLWLRSGRAAEAHGLVSAVLAKFNEGFGTADPIKARKLLAESAYQAC